MSDSNNNAPCTWITRWGFAVAAFLFMAAASFMDNMRGPLIPVAARALGITYGDAGMFFVVGQAVAATAALGLFAALRRWGARDVALATLGAGLLVAVGASAVTGWGGFLVLAGLSGVYTGTSGTVSNIILIRSTPEAIRGRLVSGLHAMYGLASIASPMVVSGLVTAGFEWPTFFLATFPLTVVAFVAVWRFVPLGASPPPTREGAPQRWAPQVFIVALFCVFVGGEVLMSGWMAAWLVGARSIPIEHAGFYVTGFFTVLFAVRMAGAAFLRPEYERWLLPGVLVALIFFNSLAQTVDPRWFAACGVVGLYYPMLLSRVSRLFPAEWQNITVWLGIVVSGVMSGFYFAISAAADRWGVATAYTMTIGLQVAALGMTLVLLRLERVWCGNE